MKKLLALIIVAALGWSAYWYLGAQGYKSAMASWLDDRRAEGWQVEYSDHKLSGFPNRFDTTFTDLQLTDPETGLSWSAPRFQLLSLSYQPNHVIAVWPQEQTIATPAERLTIRTEDMRASLKLRPTRNLALENATVVVTAADVASTTGWTSSFDTLNAAIREGDLAANAYDLGVDIKQLVPGERLKAAIDRAGSLPNLIEELRLDLVMGLAGPLDLDALEDARPAVTRLLVNGTKATWGQLELRSKGDLTVDPASAQPQGELAVTARNWREMLRLAVEAGAIDSGAAQAVEFGLSLLAGASGGENSLDATLSFSGGRTFLGPIPIGPAPEIRLP